MSHTAAALPEVIAMPRSVMSVMDAEVTLQLLCKQHSSVSASRRIRRVFR